jgi:hypothetical protein
MFHQQNNKGGKTMKKIAVIGIAVLSLLVGFRYASTQETMATARPLRCLYTVSPLAEHFSYPGGGGGAQVIITQGENCGWAAVSHADWITLTPNTGTGNGNVSYTVLPNLSQKARHGTLKIAKKTVKITQDGDPTTLVLFNLPTALDGACLNEPYTYDVQPFASGGLGAPYHFQLDTMGGFPPMGLILAPNGVISGSPTVPGKKTFSVCAVDVGGHYKCDKTSITVSSTPCCSGGPYETCYPEQIVCPGDPPHGCTINSCANYVGGHAHGWYEVNGLYFCCDLDQDPSCYQAANNAYQECCGQ